MYRNGREKGEIVQILEPYPRRSSAEPLRIYFEIGRRILHIRYSMNKDKNLVSHIYIPRRHFANFPDECEVLVSDGTTYYECKEEAQELLVNIRGIITKEVELMIRPKD